MTIRRRRLDAAPVLLLLTMVLGGCSWFGGDDEELGPEPLMEFEPEGEVLELWDGRVGAGLGERYTRLVPAIDGDVLYAADAYGVVEARRLEDGERLWQTRIGSPEGGVLGAVAFWGRDDDEGSFVTGGVGAGEGRLFLGTENGELVALRGADGEELWRFQLSSEILAPVAAGDGRVFVVSEDGRLTALAAEDGTRIWSYDTQVPVLTLRGTGAPVWSDPIVFAGFANGRLTALRGESGEVLWEHVVALPSGRSELERIADLDGSPLLTPVGAFVASYQGAIKSLRLQDGAVQWERPISSHAELAEGYGQIYSTDEDGVIRAMDQVSGNVVWEQAGLARRGVTGPAVFGPWLAVGDFEGWVHLFAQSDGRPLARVRVDRNGIRNAPISTGDRLVVLGNGGRLVVLRFERG
ncbi:MAG: outer membrane protein assembly factor BamB [Pseudomonadales bacterium]|jgi:outer membrane protein assembly factor BamB|nr:outer membrane protein assembly factor BamB [Pseudomonadales bacterium]